MTRGGLIAILLASFLIAVFAASRLSFSLSKISVGGDKEIGGKPANLLTQTNYVKVRADLKSVATALNTFYSENNRFPSSLGELGNYGVDTSNIVYFKCSETSVFFYSNTSGFPGYLIQDDFQDSTKGKTNC